MIEYRTAAVNIILVGLSAGVNIVLVGLCSIALAINYFGNARVMCRVTTMVPFSSS